MKRDNDFIEKKEFDELNKKLMENENIELPESLKKEKLEEKIKDIPQTDYSDINKEPVRLEKTKNSKRKNILRGISVAAVFAIVITSLAIAKPFNKKNPQLEPNRETANLSSKDNYSEIEKLFIGYSKKYKRNSAVDNIVNEFVDDNKAGDTAMPNTNSTTDGLGDGSNRQYGETNIQVDGVKEADIIKNDGKYLYCVANRADWDKYYTESDAYFNSMNQDDYEETTKGEGEYISPQYDPNEKPAEETLEAAKSNGTPIEKPVLDYKAVIDIYEPDSSGKINKKSRIDIEADNKDIFLMNVNEIYVTGNKLVAILNCELNNTEKEIQGQDRIINGPFMGDTGGYVVDVYRNIKMLTLIICYDVEDISQPKESFRFYQDGDYISSRLIDNSLILLTNYGVNLAYDEDTIKNNCIPKIGAAYNNMGRVPLKDIEIMDKVNDSQYLVATNMNIESEKSIKTQAVLGAGNNVYCTRDNLYVTNAKYESYDLNSSAFGEDTLKTYIYKFDVRNYDIKLLCKTSVDGNALNQFSIDEYKGNLRIATTLGDFSEGLSNSLYVLDSNLKEIGSLKNIARGEHIKAVRFTGDTAYMVTFEQTDPLFVINLKNPQSPKVIGELKIPGFSSYLHPITESLVLGVGMGGDEEGIDGSIKLSLFDVSNPEKPVECSKVLLKGSSDNGWVTSYMSDSLFNHKALCYDSDNKIMYVPYSKHSEKFISNTGDYDLNQEAGILKIKVDIQNKKLINDGLFIGEHEDDNYITGFNRVTYINDIVFAYSEYEAYLCSFSGKTKKQIDISFAF